MQLAPNNVRVELFTVSRISLRTVYRSTTLLYSRISQTFNDERGNDPEDDEIDCARRATFKR